MANILTLLIVGAVAGWLASVLMKTKGFTLGGFLVLGILGAVLGGVVFDVLGLIPSSIVARIISATVGAMIVIWAVKAIWKKA